jgi:hypothetical protein
MGKRVGLLVTMTASARHFIFDIVKLVVIQTRPKIDHGNPFPTHSEVRWCVVDIFLRCVTTL